MEAQSDVRHFTLDRPSSLLDIVASVEKDGWPTGLELDVVGATDIPTAQGMVREYARQYHRSAEHFATAYALAIGAGAAVASYVLGQVIDQLGPNNCTLASVIFGGALAFFAACANQPRRITLAYALCDKMRKNEINVNAVPVVEIPDKRPLIMLPTGNKV